VLRAAGVRSANTELAHLPVTTGYANLREIAVGRLLLDNIEHVKAFWIMITRAWPR